MYVVELETNLGSILDRWFLSEDGARSYCRNRSIKPGQILWIHRLWMTGEVEVIWSFHLSSVDLEKIEVYLPPGRENKYECD